MMSITELLALLGIAWSRLILYPAGLTALLALFALHHVQRLLPQVALDTHAAPIAEPMPLLLVLSSIALPWIGLALLPLPLAANLARPVDIVILVALLEWPRILAAGSELRAGHVRRAAALLNSYPPLVLSVLLLVQANGSFEAQALIRTPAPEASAQQQIAYWSGALALLLTLPALLGIGPFAAGPASHMALRIGLGLRGIGFAALCASLWAGLIPEKLRWLLPLPALVLGLLVWLVHVRGMGQAALPWARGLYWLSLLLLLVMLMVTIMYGAR